MKKLIPLILLIIFPMLAFSQVTAEPDENGTMMFRVGDTTIVVFEYESIPGMFIGRTNDSVYAIFTREIYEILLEIGYRPRIVGYYILDDMKIPIWVIIPKRTDTRLI